MQSLHDKLFTIILLQLVRPILPLVHNCSTSIEAARSTEPLINVCHNYDDILRNIIDPILRLQTIYYMLTIS